MAKDPAFLFYPNDYIGGTMGMTFEEKGAYIELLMLQFNRGHMSLHIIQHMIGDIWDKIKDKFVQDENGLWYNKRLESEKTKRQNYNESRRNNRNSNQYICNSDSNETNIYVFKDQDSGYIKIGASINPANRLSTIKSRQGKNIVLIATADNCTLGDEKKLHKYFADFNIKGDWFNINEKVVIDYVNNHMNKHMILHMENENENVIINDNKDKHVKQKEKSKNDFLDQIIQAFVDVHGDYEVISPGKERMATAKLLGIYKKKYPRATSEETIAGLKSYFEACVAIPDDWLRTNMSIPIIVSQFNKINQILKHGNKKMGATTDLQLAEIVAKHFAND